MIFFFGLKCDDHLFVLRFQGISNISENGIRWAFAKYQWKITQNIANIFLKHTRFARSIWYLHDS